MFLMKNCRRVAMDDRDDARSEAGSTGGATACADGEKRSFIRRRAWKTGALGLVLALAAALPAPAADIRIAYLARSLPADPPYAITATPRDHGVAGAQLGLN